MALGVQLRMRVQFARLPMIELKRERERERSITRAAASV